MPTTITSATHPDSLSGSPEKRLDVEPDGTLWALIIDNSRARFFSSSNGGSTWAVSAGSDLSLGSGQDTAVPSFFIDADGYAHVSFVRWQANPQTVTYARGTPRTGGGWSWNTLTISPAGGRTGVDSDLVVFRNGTGWVAWVLYDLSGSGGVRVAQVTISATGALAVAATSHGPASGDQNYQYGSIEFAHTGDGKTPAASPHLFLVTTTQASGTPVYAHRAAYSGGIWTWGTPIQLATGVTNANTALCSVFDGAYLMTAWSPSDGTIKVSEWDGAAGSATARNPPTLPGGSGNVLGLSLAADPTTDDIYLAAYCATIGNVIYCKFTRSMTTWGSWTTSVTRSATSEDGDVQLVRHPPRDSIDMLYSTGSGPYTISSSQLVPLTRSPSVPSLISPPNGAALDLATGATFTWTYNPVSPGDTQQAYQLRRIYGGGPTTEYWNAGSSNWQSTAVWNSSSNARAEFPAGKWTTGTTYSWSVQTRSSTNADSGWAPDRTVTASIAPNVVVTSPTGISYGDSTPLVTWTYTSVTAQRDYRVRIVPTFGVTIDPNDPLPATWDSGVVGSSIARSVRVGTALTNNTAYRAYVKCTDVNAVSSPWVYTDFTVSITPPTGPSIETIDEISYDTSVPRVRLDLTARSNFLSTGQGNGQSGWEVDANCTLTAQADNSASQLLASLKMTSAGSGTLSARTVPGSPPAAPFGKPALTRPLSFPVTANTDYTAVASFKAAATTRAARIRIRWYDNDDGTGALISESVGDQITSGTTSYVQAYVTATAPQNAVMARLVVEVLGATGVGEIFYVARISLHPGRDTATQSGGYSSTQTMRVERSDDGGLTWDTLIARIKPDYRQKVTAYDRLMPFGKDVQYRAYTDVDPGNGAILSSAVSPVSVVYIDASIWAIRDPNDDTAEFNAYITNYTRADSETFVVHRPAGRTFPVVDTEGLQAGTGSFTLYVMPADQDKTYDVLQRTIPMVVQSPTGLVLWVRFPSRAYDVINTRARTISIDYYEVES